MFLTESKYREDEDSTVTHNSVEYSINKILSTVDNKNVVEIDVSKLIWVFEYDNPRIDRIKKANIKYPIIAVEDNNELVAIDGLHRLAKMYLLDIKKAKCKMITTEELQSCMI